ncbi:type II secretion system protein [Hydrogenimonas sp.]
MRKAFTLIELIFVIVILGIVAGVAVTKLSGTRDDATVAHKAQQITSAMYEIAAYAVGQGWIDGNFTKVSNVIAQMERRGECESHPDDYNVTFRIGKKEACVTLLILNGTNEQNLTIVFGQNGDDPVCKGVQDILHEVTYPIVLSGHVAKF